MAVRPRAPPGAPINGIQPPLPLSEAPTMDTNLPQLLTRLALDVAEAQAFCDNYQG